MLNKIRHFISQHELLDLKEHYLVALSGGADSVALLRVLLLLGYQVEAAHCNFKRRGDESDRDEQFVRQLCNELGVSLHLVHFDTLTYSQTHHVSIEMAARELRYHYFAQLMNDIGAKAVCIAHHRDDSVETLLMNLIRGTGIHGLTGIRPSRPGECGTGSIVRPLLCVGRQEIEQWLEEIGQPFVTDSTNLVADVLRNKTRLNLIPQLTQLHPQVVENIKQTTMLIGEAEKVYNAFIQSFLKKHLANHSLPIAELLNTPSPLCILFEWLGIYGFRSSAICQIASSLHSQTGHHWLSATHELCIDRGMLLLLPREDKNMVEMKLPEPGLYNCPDGRKLRVSIIPSPIIRRDANVACFDAGSVAFPLTLRHPRQADRFRPFGMKGSKLISDYLTDLKLSMPEKRRQWLLTDAQGNIIWVIGQRTAAPYCINGNTRQTLLIELLS